MSVVINVIQARGLPKADATGSIDAYFNIKYGKETKKTKTIENTKTPTFNEKFFFKYNPSLGDEILIECWDWDKMSKDDFVATTTLKISEFRNNKVKKWIRLTPSKSFKDQDVGEVELEVEFNPGGSSPAGFQGPPASAYPPPPGYQGPPPMGAPGQPRAFPAPGPQSGAYPPPQGAQPMGQYPPPGAYPPAQGQYPPPGAYPPAQGQYPPPGAYPPTQGQYPPPGAYPPAQGQYPPPGAYPPAQGQYPPPGAYPPPQGAQPMVPYGQPPPMMAYGQPPPQVVIVQPVVVKTGPTRIYLKQKTFTWGDKFTVKNEQYDDIYYIKGETFVIGKKLHIYDAKTNTELAFLHEKVMTLWAQYNVDLMFPTPSSFIVKREYKIGFGLNFNVVGLGWTLKGDMSNHDYCVMDANGAVVFQLEKKWFRWGDSYEISFNNPSLQLACLCVSLAIDAFLEKDIGNNRDTAHHHHHRW